MKSRPHFHGNKFSWIRDTVTFEGFSKNITGVMALAKKSITHMGKHVLSPLCTQCFSNSISIIKIIFFCYIIQVNLNKGCPFWVDDSKCAMKNCHVDVCNEVCLN